MSGNIVVPGQVQSTQVTLLQAAVDDQTNKLFDVINLLRQAMVLAGTAEDTENDLPMS